MVQGVDQASNRNQYQEYFLLGKGGRCARLTTLLPSCADFLGIWGSLHLLETSVPVRDCKGIVLLIGQWNDKAVDSTKLGKTKNDKFSVCCPKSDELQFLNIFFAKKNCHFCRPNKLCLLNCITETIQVTNGRMFISPALLC